MPKTIMHIIALAIPTRLCARALGRSTICTPQPNKILESTPLAVVKMLDPNFFGSRLRNMSSPGTWGYFSDPAIFLARSK